MPSQIAESRGSQPDPESQTWVAALRPGDLRRERAIQRLHAVLLSEARFEVRRLTSWPGYPCRADCDDLAVQVADDAVVAILAKLDQFRGQARFLTWARRIAQHGVPAALRHLAASTRELPVGDGFEQGRLWPSRLDAPYEQSVARESAEALATIMAEELTAWQRRVLIALVIEGIPAGELAPLLGTNRGALYKTLHDARSKLRARVRDGQG